MHNGNQKPSWDDLRFVLAVAESGSVSAAARRLCVNHATVLRRVAAFESAHGAAIFERSAQGYTVRPDKLRVIAAARDAALAVDRVERLARGTGDTGTERVRLTSTDTFCQAVLPPILPFVLRALAEPGLRIDLVSSNDHTDLGRLRADIAVRPALELPPDLTGAEAGILAFAAYAAPGAGALPWLGLRGALGRSRPAVWLGDVLADDDAGQAGHGSDSFLVLREMAAAGIGRTVLPCCLGDPDARLERLPALMPEMAVPIWVASHADLASDPRLLRLRERLVAALLARAPLLSGRVSG